jgi:hypothetical protein
MDGMHILVAKELSWPQVASQSIISRPNYKTGRLRSKIPQPWHHVYLQPSGMGVRKIAIEMNYPELEASRPESDADRFTSERAGWYVRRY